MTNLVRHVAILRRHDRTDVKLVPVPAGQSIDMDEHGRRQWLWPHIGTEWHLMDFVALRSLPERLQDEPECEHPVIPLSDEKVCRDYPNCGCGRAVNRGAEP